MVAISSTAVGAQAATQAGWQQLKLQQARQNADRAEAVAQSLAARAAEAQRVAERAQESARDLSVQSGQAQSAAGKARQGLAMLHSVGEMQTRLSNTVGQVVERQDVAPIAESMSRDTTPPVVNLSGQVTGTVVNTTA